MKERSRGGQGQPALRESGGQGVNALRQAILRQARGQARQLLHEAQIEVQSVQRQAEQEAETIAKEILDQARHETGLEKQRRISAARLEVHRKQLAQREDQIDALFAGAKERLEALHHSDRYAEILRHLVVEAATALGGGELTVLTSKEDADLLTDDLLASVAHELGEDTALARGEEFLEGGAGVVLETADGRLRYDNTFAGRLDRYRDLLRTEAYEILTGDE